MASATTDHRHTAREQLLETVQGRTLDDAYYEQLANYFGTLLDRAFALETGP